MPSDLAPPPPGRGSWLRSQGLGLLCGQATVVLLGIGSLVIVRTRDGASAGVQLDDITAFFKTPSWVHAWFYALLAVMALYALNTLLCTWDSVLAKWRQGIRQASAYAPAVIHLSFLVALLAHAVGGVWNREQASVLLGPAWQALSSGRQARVVALTEDRYPDGRTRSVDARVEVREADGATHQATVGYNEPLSRGFGAELYLLAEAGTGEGTIELSPDGAVAPSCRLAALFCTPSHREGLPRFAGCSIAPGSCTAGDVTATLEDLQRSPQDGTTLAVLTLSTPTTPATRLVVTEGKLAHFANVSIRFSLSGSMGPTLALRSRAAPGNPIAFGSAVLLALGLGLMGRRWLTV